MTAVVLEEAVEITNRLLGKGGNIMTDRIGDGRSIRIVQNKDDSLTAYVPARWAGLFTDMLVEGRQGSTSQSQRGSTTIQTGSSRLGANQEEAAAVASSLFIDDYLFYSERRPQGIEERVAPTPPPASRALGRCQEIYLLFLLKKFLGWSL